MAEALFAHIPVAAAVAASAPPGIMWAVVAEAPACWQAAAWAAVQCAAIGSLHCAALEAVAAEAPLS
ncbi:MAG TPA: hypothetical protein VL332_12630 [Candidatus Saccharimonadaceae bacterium]|jgi:hypothetical protein|nr:hypothetical protein [Candidatus Saccharimonadaceae bacterium]